MLDENDAPPEGEDVTADEVVDTPNPPAVTVTQAVAGDGDTRWLKYADDQGISANGNPEPLVDIGLTITVPTMIANPETGKLEIGEVASSLQITHAPTLDIFTPARFIEGGRIVETRDERVVTALMGTGYWAEIDRPTKKDLAAHVKEQTAAIEEAANRSDEER